MKFNLSSKQWFFFLLICGVALRLVQYFYNRSLWVDEAMLAVNFTGRSFAGLTQPLEYGQIAPILFLWIEKLFVIIFGNNELSLRLFPLICSVASLWFIYRLTFTITKDQRTSLIVLLLIAFSRTFIYFSNETKQYSSDIFLSVTFLFLILSDKEFIAKYRFELLLITGLIGVWLSNTSIILITALAGWYFLNQIIERKFRVKEWVLTATLYLWFGIYYFVLVKDNPNNAGMYGFWLEHFMTLNPFQLKFWSWMVQHFSANYATMIGLNNHQPHMIRIAAAMLMIMSAIYGYVKLFKSNYKAAMLLVLPVVIHLAVSSLHLYPFNGRLILYLAPSFLIPACYGISCVFIFMKERVYLTVSGYVFALVFAVFMLIQIPFRLEEAKDCLEFVKANNNTASPLIAYVSSIPAVSYYADQSYNMERGKYSGHVRYLRRKEDILGEIERSGSVWVLITHRTSDQTEILTLPVKSIKSYSTNGAAVHLLVKG